MSEIRAASFRAMAYFVATARAIQECNAQLGLVAGRFESKVNTVVAGYGETFVLPTAERERIHAALRRLRKEEAWHAMGALRDVLRERENLFGGAPPLSHLLWIRLRDDDVAWLAAVEADTRVLPLEAPEGLTPMRKRLRDAQDRLFAQQGGFARLHQTLVGTLLTRFAAFRAVGAGALPGISIPDRSGDLDDRVKVTAWLGRARRLLGFDTFGPRGPEVPYPALEAPANLRARLHELLEAHHLLS